MTRAISFLNMIIDVTGLEASVDEMLEIDRRAMMGKASLYRMERKKFL